VASFGPDIYPLDLVVIPWTFLSKPMNVRKLVVIPWTFLTKPMNVRKVVSSGNEWSNQMRILRPNQTAAKVGVCDRQLRDLEAQGLSARNPCVIEQGEL